MNYIEGDASAAGSGGFPASGEEGVRSNEGSSLEILRGIFEQFFLVTGFSVGIMAYPSRKHIFAAGKREICSKFHLAFPESEKRCLQSNTLITEKFKNPGEFKIHRCKNSMIYGAVPIVVDNAHLASIFFGQVLFKPPEIERFKKQAAKFGYDVDQYLEALRAVPVVSEKQFMDALSFVGKFSVMISEALGYRKELEDKRKIFEQDIFNSIEMEERMKLLAAELPLIKEEERRRIGNLLHDSIGQNLALTKMKISELISSPVCREISETLKEIERLTTHCIDCTRTMAFKLDNPLLYEVGLEPAVEWLIEYYRERYGLECSLKTGPEEIPIDRDTRVLLYQSLRELLVNNLKHAKATRTQVSITHQSNRVKVEIQDNGVGFCESGKKSGMGLFCIRERLARVGGQFRIKSEPGKGSRFTLIAPVRVPEKKGNNGNGRRPIKAGKPRNRGPRGEKKDAAPAAA